MSTGEALSFRKHYGRNPQISAAPIFLDQLIIDDADGIRLGYVSTKAERPPVNLIVRVSPERVDSIKTQVEQYLGKSVSGVSMPPRLTRKIIQHVSKLVNAADMQPFVRELEVELEEEDDDE